MVINSLNDILVVNRVEWQYYAFNFQFGLHFRIHVIVTVVALIRILLQLNLAQVSRLDCIQFLAFVFD